MDPECTAERMLDASQEFVFDLQTHHVEAIRSEDYESWFYLAVTEQALCGKELTECFSRDAYIDLMFMQSHTSLAMLSAVPAVEGELPLGDMAAARRPRHPASELVQACDSIPSGAKRNTTTGVSEIASGPRTPGRAARLDPRRNQ